MMQRDAPPKPIERDVEQLEFVAGIASRLSSERTIQAACLVILEESMALTGATCGEVLFRDARGEVTTLANRGPHPWCVSQTGGQMLSSRLLETTFQDHLPLHVSSIQASPGLNLHLGPSAELDQALSLPLVVRGRAIGAVNLCGTRSADFPAGTVAALSILSGLLAVTIENIFLNTRTTHEENARRQFFVKELEASEDERQRIARELHDGIGQTITALLLNIDAAAGLLAQPSRRSQAAGQLEKARDVAASLLQDVRRIILALRPPALDDLGLCSAVDGYAKRVLGDAGIEATVRCRRLNGNVAPLVENAVFRVVQESLSNVVRHSKARHCRVSLHTNNDVLVAVVEDDGEGFDASKLTGSYDHFGVSGMRERIRVLGGAMTIKSKPGAGTRVSVEVPYGRTRDDEEPRSSS